MNYGAVITSESRGQQIKRQVALTHTRALIEHEETGTGREIDDEYNWMFVRD